ncbi:tyrosine-protein phosphatase non-receptor type 4 isoform X20 [Macrobrachium rosenbergii]|uniref:tyrosine-protein phosphatase non-receptor type 4 isoform X20 n=2 Tax=Macrobrachium rosenbergii TaxID=79674 RepID=UPI0034D6D8E2
MLLFMVLPRRLPNFVHIYLLQEGMLEGVSRRTFGGSSGTYNVRASELARHKALKTLRVQVAFLDDSTQVFEIEKRAKGQALLDLVFNHLELIERDFFGLQYLEASTVASENPRRWLDPLKPVKKQLRIRTKSLGTCGLPVLYFRVKFWVSDPGKLTEEYTRYHVFLQLRRDILDGRLSTPASSAALLASYALQSELGDYSPEEHGNTYLSDMRLVPNQNDEIEKKIIELHKLHKGQSPADAEFNFLDHAKRLDLYGVDLHKARDSTNREIHLGVTAIGLVVLQNGIKMNTFSWAKIVKISFKRKQFFIQLRRELSENYDSVLGFNLGSYRACKCLWKSCVEHHTFFRLHTPRTPARKSPSKRFARQTVPTPSDLGRKARSGSGSSIRPRTDSSGYKVTSLQGAKTPKMAWGEAQTPEDENGYSEREDGERGVCSEDGIGLGRSVGGPPPAPPSTSSSASSVESDVGASPSPDHQVLLINGRDVSAMTHEQVVNFIRASRECHSGELVLTVKQNVYLAEELEEPAFQYVPEALPSSVSSVGVSGGQAAPLHESMLLLTEGLEAGSLVAQFEQLYRRKPGLTVSEARRQENEKKNRYRDISPYDTTRVRLTNAPSGDYINASYVNMEIQGSGIINRYIACQGPLAGTCIDFWQMVWEQQSTLIVMLTTVVEQGRVKCHRYWPRLYETVDYGTLQVTCLKEEETPGFAFREFTLINTENQDERHITHMQYLAWPDHGVPDDSTEFLNFVAQVRRARAGMVEPTIVHCSAGIGRTGVLILMETAQCLIEANEPVYPLDVVRAMRDQRAMMIQTASQYRFVCEAIQRVYSEGLVKPLAEYQQR